MKKTALSAADEILQLEQELQPLQQQERRFNDEACIARREIVKLEASKPETVITGKPNPKRLAAIEEWKQKRTTAEAPLSRAERKLLDLQNVIAPKVKRLHELRLHAGKDRAERMRLLVADAIEKAGTACTKYRIEREKLAALHSQRSELEKELHTVLTAAAGETSTAAGARILLETGQFPSSEATPDTAMRSKELISRQRVLLEAIRLQERAAADAQRAFAHEVAGHLHPIRNQIVQQIANGYASARFGTADADSLRHEFYKATSRDEVLPPLVFQVIDVPRSDAKDDFDFWIEDMRRQGFAV